MADRKEWKEQLLSKLLDQYEKSVTYAGENKVKQVFSVKPSDIFKGYNKDFLPPEQLFQEKEFERLIRQMESEGLIHVVPPNTGILRQICAVPERWEDYYACLNRTEKNILKKRLEEVYHRFCQCDLLEAYGKEKLQTLKNSRARKLDEKKVEKEITEAEAIWNLVQFLKENQEKQRTTLEREMSEAVLHDSKQWEKIYRKKVCGILEHTGRYDEPLAELEEERERQTALLEEFYIYSNPAYIYLKGDARICLEDGRELRIYHDLPMSIPFETFQKAKSIQIRDAGADDGGKSDLVSPAGAGTYILPVSEWLPYPHETGAFAADRQRKSGTFLVSFWRSRSRRSGDRGASDPKDGTAVSAVRDGCAGIAAVSDICEAIGSTRSGEGGSNDKTGQQLCGNIAVYAGAQL